MTKAITISGSTYTIQGIVTNKKDNKGVLDLHVIAYDKDIIKDDFLAIGVTDATGAFSISFDASQFQSLLDRSPDLYFEVKDAGLELLNTKENVITDAHEDTPPIHFVVDLSNDKLRKEINKTAVPGWVGGFEASNPAFAYPTPDLSSLGPLKDNMANIDKLQRQQKVLWPEFSWKTDIKDTTNESRCYQMFAPDISRLGYTNEGRVYSIICPQQGICVPHLGCMNVEVTVTGNRGWANETTRELAADMGVVGKIWFSPSANQGELVKLFGAHFKENHLDFPFDKAHAIVIETSLPGDPSQPIFPLTKGTTTAFPIPDFAKHQEISWTVGHLGVQIGAVKKTGNDKVDEFNQMVVDIFNIGAGNMLQEGNTLTWNVWFTAPELVDTEEWQNHADYWRASIEADHGSPEGPGTIARHFDGTPFQPLKELLSEELPQLIHFAEKHVLDKEMSQIATYVKKDAGLLKEITGHSLIHNFMEKYM
ncbi:MAG: hypothetical protein ACRBFS_16700 [Aureispira sp.]